MKVLLQQRVASLGQPGTIVEVTESYARNFLIPKKLAVPATAETMKRHQKTTETQLRDRAQQQSRQTELLSKLANIHVELSVPASPNGKLFAAIQERDIRAALVRQHQLNLPTALRMSGLPLKYTGDHDLPIGTEPGPTGMLHLTIRSI